ncbi:MAG: glycosyltransferase family 2 protein, partial [Candidatus Micrarchaeia archaeon]
MGQTEIKKSTAKPTVAILLPSYNEEKGIGKCIDQINELIANGGNERANWNVIVVDSCSTDGTIEISKKKGAGIIQLPIRGKGIAMKEAFTKLNTDFVIMTDADATYPIAKIPEIVERLSGGNGRDGCDVVIGSRMRGKIAVGAMTPMNKFGNQALSLFASVVYLKRITDVCSGMWGYNKKAYKMLSERISAPHLELECDMFAECAKRGMRICEIAIDYSPREGETKLNA